MIAALSRRLNLEPDELRQALILGSMLFSLTASYTLVKTARDAYFLASLPVTLLPWVFLGVGVLGLAGATLFERATHHRPTCETLGIASMVSAVALVACGWLLGTGAPWGPIAFYLWVNVYGLILMTQFWIFANSASDPREAKRILGVVGVGGILGGLAGGALAAPLVGAGGLPLLVYAAAGLLFLLMPQIYRGARLGRVPDPGLEALDPDEESVPPVRHRYVRLLAYASLWSVVVTGLLDYQFKAELQASLPTAERLAAFLGLFYTAVNLAALTVQLFVTRKALQRLGAGWSAAILPAGVGAGALAAALVPGLAPVATTRLWDQVLRQSLNRSAVELFYFPLSPGLRRRVKAVVGAGLERVGDALAGLLLIGLAAFAAAGGRTLALVVLGLVVAWVGAWVGVRRGYVKQLARNLRRMTLHHERESISLREASLLAEMHRLVQHPFERVVLHGMELLEENAPEALSAHLPALLEHRSARVRERAVALAATRGGPAFLEAIAARVQDEDPDVRLAALRARRVMGDLNPLDAFSEFLDGDDPRHRRAALLCAAECVHGPDEARLLDRFERLLREGTPEDRVAVAEAVGRCPAGSSLHAVLGPLLRDHDPEVRMAAFASAGRLQRRTDVPPLIDALLRPRERDVASVALAAYGDGVVGTLADWLSDPTVPVEVRRQLPRVLGEIGTQEAANALMRFRGHEDVRLAYRVLKACNRIRAADRRVRFDAARVSEDLEHDARAFAFALVHSIGFPPESGGPRSVERLLGVVFEERMEQALDRVFRRLALLYPPRAIYDAWRGLSAEDRRVRGHALEYLENALDPAHRALVLPLVDVRSGATRMRFVEMRWGLRPLPPDATLEAILDADDAWLRAVALHVIGSRRERRLLARVEAQLTASDALVRETAAWARGVLAMG